MDIDMTHSDSYRKGYQDALAAAENACLEFRKWLLTINDGDVDGRVYRHGAGFGAYRCVEEIRKLKGGDG